MPLDGGNVEFRYRFYCFVFQFLDVVDPGKTLEFFQLQVLESVRRLLSQRVPVHQKQNPSELLFLQQMIYQTDSSPFSSWR